MTKKKENANQVWIKFSDSAAWILYIGLVLYILEYTQCVTATTTNITLLIQVR